MPIPVVNDAADDLLRYTCKVHQLVCVAMHQSTTGSALTITLTRLALFYACVSQVAFLVTGRTNVTLCYVLIYIATMRSNM